MRITFVSVKLVSSSCRRFQNGKKSAAIKLCVELNKTAIEMPEMLKGVYSEECIRRTSVSEWHRRSTKGECRCKTMNGKAVLQLPEQMNQQK
jgi:hypothetical protein